MTAAERLNALLKHLHTNVKSFSELCGYDRPQAFYDIQKGKTKNLSPSMSEKILSTFPSINRIWLLTGEGSMIVEENNNQAKPKEPDEQPVYVPLVHISALAGPIKAYYESGEDLSSCERILSPIPNAEIAVPISGDSMEPLIPDGTIVFVRRINEASFIPWGHPLVIDTENGIFVKNVLPDDNDTHYVWADSINPKYPRMHVPKQSIYAMYRILSMMKNYITM